MIGAAMEGNALEFCLFTYTWKKNAWGINAWDDKNGRRKHVLQERAMNNGTMV